MKLQGSLACLLLALCLGSGAAVPLQSGGESGGPGLGHAISHGVGEAVGQGAKEAASSGIQNAIGQGGAEAASRTRELADTVSHGLGEAAHALENPGRQVENAIRNGVEAARGGSEAWGTSGGHGILGHNQGNLGGPGSPWGQGHPGGSGGNFGTNSLGGSAGQGANGGSLDFGPNAQGAVAQPGYGSVRGSSQNSGCLNPPPSGSGGSSSNSGESSSSQSGSGGSSSHGGSSSGNSGSGSGNSGSGSGSSGSGSGSGNSGSGSGNSGSGSSSGYSQGQPLENSKDLDSSFSVSRGSDSGPSSGGSGGGRGGYKPECDNPGNEARGAGGSGSQESREPSLLGSLPKQGQGFSGDGGRGDAVNGLNTVNSQTSPGIFNFDTFWKNFKSKMGFINWEAIEKGQVPSPSTRALLYFRRLWENFKHRTPFFNWQKITEDADMATFQKRAGGADQFSQSGSERQEVPAVTSKNYNYNQQAYPTAYYGQSSVKTPAKGGATISSSASRVQPGLLQWVKFW